MLPKIYRHLPDCQELISHVLREQGYKIQIVHLMT